MRTNKEKIYSYLFACQERFGGYTGRDIDEIARSSSAITGVNTKNNIRKAIMKLLNIFVSFMSNLEIHKLIHRCSDKIL